MIKFWSKHKKFFIQICMVRNLIKNFYVMTLKFRENSQTDSNEWNGVETSFHSNEMMSKFFIVSFHSNEKKFRHHFIRLGEKFATLIPTWSGPFRSVETNTIRINKQIVKNYVKKQIRRKRSFWITNKFQIKMKNWIMKIKIERILNTYLRLKSLLTIVDLIIFFSKSTKMNESKQSQIKYISSNAKNYRTKLKCKSFVIRIIISKWWLLIIS